jgi:alginate O-acetyltransferase complex protein AlgI
MHKASPMLFTGSAYAIFLAVSYSCFWLLRTKKVLRALFLVLSSYFFYAYGTYETAVNENQKVPFGILGWTALCLGIIFVGSTLDYGIARLLHRTEALWKRRLLLVLSVAYYLGVLAVFKYYDFAMESVADVAAKLGVPFRPTLFKLVLPFGISFFTFETMSYTIDVYRRELKPAENYLEYLLFVCFFPHLVAGPIVRPHSMLPQLAKEPVYSAGQVSEGLYLIGSGLVRKILIGDNLSEFMVKGLFERPDSYSTLETWVGVYGYAFKIYCDFSGYTDVARGSAKLFGYELPLNFDAPYLSQNLQDFWRRWHISLSSWLRDYLYIPLGGSKGSNFFTYRNLMLTMVLGGLWHGASWNFVIWGFLHGLALGVTRAYQRIRPPPESGADGESLLGRWIAVALTFHYVCFAWIFFNAKTLPLARDILGNLVRVGSVTALNFSHFPPKAMAALFVAAALHCSPKMLDEKIQSLFQRAPAPVQGALLAATMLAIHLGRGSRSLGFIYGQF